MASHPVTSPTGSRETLWAIVISFVLSIVLASFVAGNPFSALGRAYRDYAKEPRPGAAASTTQAPANNTAAPAK